MADYMQMLNGAFGKLAGKVKSAADSTGVMDVYAQGASRAKAFAQVTKLTLDVNAAHTELDRVYAEIGWLYFEQMRHAPEGLFVPLFEQVERIGDGIRAKEAEIEALKSQYLEPGSEPSVAVEIDEFEDVVAAAEREATRNE